MNRFFRKIAPAALILGIAVGGCDGMNINIGGSDGVPLSELDYAGQTANALVVASSDTVRVDQGETLDITVDGNPGAVEAVRFSLSDGTLTISRADGDWSSNDGSANIRVIMPSLTAITLAGSGTVEASNMSGDVDVTVAGSGNTVLSDVAAGNMTATIAGSGNLTAAGMADALELTIAGSGGASMAKLQVAAADVTVAGSGSAAFASDGKVTATIMGSGDVDVTGNAQCEAEVMGSGELRCSATNANGNSEASPAE